MVESAEVRVTVWFAVVTVLPSRSWIVATGWVLSAAPLAAVDGAVRAT
jgi:hypothetical protein